MSYLGKIPANTVSEKAFCTVDLLPTFARLAGADLPENEIDGLDIWELLISSLEAASNPHEYYPFSTGRTFERIISADGKWKLHLPHKYKTLAEVGKDGKPGRDEDAFKSDLVEMMAVVLYLISNLISSWHL